MGCCCCCKRKEGTGRLDESTSLIVSFSSSSVIVPDGVASFTPRRLFANPPSPFDPMKSRVEWNHPDGIMVGDTTVATIKLCRHDGSPYQLKNSDIFTHNIHHEDSSVTVNSVREPSTALEGHESLRISYTARHRGVYTLVFRLNGERIKGQQFRRRYIAGPPVQGRTTIHNQSNYMILHCGIYTTITISPRDAYGNIAQISPMLLHILVRKGGPHGDVIIPDCVVMEHYDESKLDIQVKLDEPGYYIGFLRYEDTVIGLKNCIILCLTDVGMQKVEQNKNTSFLNMEYKAKLMPMNFNEEIRSVRCYISPRLFQIRESSMLFFSKRVFTCRVCNSTKITFHEDPGKFTVDDGLQLAVTLVSEFREIIVATFYSFIQKNSGGAESFQDKRKHFHSLIRQANPNISHTNRATTQVNVRRYNLLESAMQATKGFKPATWKSKFHVVFQGEAGIDVGGVTREFFTCICDTLFGSRTQTGLFRRFCDDPQGLVHPSTKDQRDASLGLEYYEFAGRIVGKCLFDSAIENPLFVKAHFSRSFLALLIGQRISWKHFETDDPDLYRFKIEQIRTSDIADLDLSLTFTDEVYDGRQLSSPLVVSLFPGGSKQRVTDNNKMDFLNELAQHRLVKTVTEEMRAFIKGLKDLIPEDSLTIFDENELELLMCGVQKLDFHDLKRHTEVRGHTSDFLQSVQWFWMAVEEFSPEELARLVQFVTGSSQIPPGGFGELRPPFLLASSGIEYNRLPYAHTCFNHLCLPNYDTYELFRRSIMTAINEGSEGILLS